MHYYPVFLVRAEDEDDAAQSVVNNLMDCNQNWAGAKFDYFDETPVKIAKEGTKEYKAMVAEAEEDRDAHINEYWKNCRRRLPRILKNKKVPRSLPYGPVTELNDIRRLLDGHGAIGVDTVIDMGAGVDESGDLFAVKMDLHY